MFYPLNSTDRAIQSLSSAKEAFLDWYLINQNDIFRAVLSEVDSGVEKFKCLSIAAQTRFICEVVTVLASLYSPAKSAINVGKAGATAIKRSELRAIAQKYFKELKNKGIVDTNGAIIAGSVVSAPGLIAKVEALKSTGYSPLPFVKKNPLYGFKITKENFRNIPQYIKDRLGKIDGTNYDDTYFEENIGGAIALQVKDNTPDFYFISKSQIESSYRSVSKSEVGATGPKYFDKLKAAAPDLELNNSNIMGIQKTQITQMYKASDLGISIGSEAKFESPWGFQTKPAGADAFFAFDEGSKKYYLINTEANGNPIAYSPAGN